MEPELSTTRRDGDGQIGVLEADDGLLDAVFEDLEVVLGEVLDQVSVPSSTVAFSDHFFDVGVQDVAAVFLVQRFAARGRGGFASGERTGSRSTVSGGAWPGGWPELAGGRLLRWQRNDRAGKTEARGSRYCKGA